MKQDIAAVRRKFQQKSGSKNQPDPTTEPDIQEKSYLSAVRRIVQRKASLGKPPDKPMVKLAAPPVPKPVEQKIQAKIPTVEQPGTAIIKEDVAENTKPAVPDHAIRENNVDNSTENQQTTQYVEETSIVNMLRSAVDQISVITDNLKNQ